MTKIIKRIVLSSLGVLIAYFAFGIIISDYVFPTKEIDLANYFRSGDKFFSDVEGFDQMILANNDGWVHLSLAARPFAAGPPEHLHENFEETFTVKSGTLSILVGGEKRTLRAGESFTVPRLTLHKPFNETAETVVVESIENTKTMPTHFAYFLSQLYPMIDRFDGRASRFAMIMQLSVYGNEMDSYLAEGPPVKVQKGMRVLLRPTARLLGYKYYYDEYKPEHLN